MNTPQKFRIAIGTILCIALVSLTFKAVPIAQNLDDFFAEEMYRVTYRFFFKTNDGHTSVKTYLPKNNSRQRITHEVQDMARTMVFEKKADENNLKGVWVTAKKDSYESIDYQFTFEGKARVFALPESFGRSVKAHSKYLAPSKYIQSDHPKLKALAARLTQDTAWDRKRVQNLFNFVREIPSAPIITLTDALTVLERNKASCSGKSRLLVALARGMGFPARIKGGIILQESNKRTSHVWAEININGQWIPFDALNGHFAYLPANYLELYEGDEFLITRSPGLQFDYSYEIKKENKIPFLRTSASQFNSISPISLWGLVESKLISTESLLLLLMLPVGGLLVAFLRNVVGLRTFGVFLPVLIAFSLLETGFTTGMLLFMFLILFVGIISRPFNQMGLLHTPKLVISLTLMVVVMAVGSYLGVITGVGWLTSLTFFPTIILTISAERFSTLIVEDGFHKATGTLFQTLIAVSFCFFMLSSKWLPSILILFPEILLVIIAMAMLLGRYIGLRWTEILRFKPLLTFKLS
ncbi:7TM domain-containing protein [Flavobacteriaceae bacterium 3-367]